MFAPHPPPPPSPAATRSPRWRHRLSRAGIPVLALAMLAADHAESPTTKADLAADITDVYAWHDAAVDRLTTVINVAGLQAPVAGQEGAWDDEILLTLHLDRTGDAVAEVLVEIRFGQAVSGAWGVQVRNLPGTSGPVAGAVEQVLDAGGGAKVFAGLRDDPFFFDLDGFRATLSTGTLSFDNTRDSFAGTNITSVVLEMPLSAATLAGTAPNLRIWATSARLPVPTAVATLPTAPQPRL